MKYDKRCSACGKFCIPADKGTRYGRCDATEPPDPEYFCEKCAYKEYRHCLHVGWVDSAWWQQPEFIIKAARKLNLIYAGPKGAAWGNWFRPYEIPVDFEVWKME